MWLRSPRASSHEMSQGPMPDLSYKPDREEHCSQEQELKPTIMLKKKKYSLLQPAHVFKSTRTPATRCTGETQIPCQMLVSPTLHVRVRTSRNPAC
jgi:hypothetical protein